MAYFNFHLIIYCIIKVRERYLINILVIRNSLDNALKHADNKSTIEVELKSDGNNIILRVRDTGDVIPKGEEEKIFEKFYRLDKSRSRKDNRYGLRLAIAKNIVVNHKGKIRAKSTGKETAFEVVFKK